MYVYKHISCWGLVVVSLDLLLECFFIDALLVGPSTFSCGLGLAQEMNCVKTFLVAP